MLAKRRLGAAEVLGTSEHSWSATASRALSRRLVLVDDGGKRAALETAARAAPCLQMLGCLPDDEFRRAIAAADALLVNEKPGVAGIVVPSKLTSYMSAGLPVIASTDSGSVKESEVLLSGGAVVVPSGAPGALLAVAETLAAD